MAWRVGAWLFAPSIAWLTVAGVGLAFTAADAEAWEEVDRDGAEVVRSDECRRCHPREWDSWHHSYHRTMTQEATGDAVLAPFAGEVLDYGGYVATMSRSEDGAPHLRVREVNGGEPLLDVDVEYTVGSHRYQQYVARLDRGGGAGEFWRLPVAWHLGEKRWIHMNGAFVEPEGEDGDPDAYLRHLSRWNDNCIFCHNTEPAPGLDDAGHFESKLGEVGIACEACHGPAGEHLVRHQNPLRRLLAEGSDGSIAQPGRLAPREESSVCGRCHGQRIGKNVGEIMRHGDGFLPGNDLATVSRPIFRDSQVAGGPEAQFESRFWPDGTPRLSAYEYQGLLSSACYQDGQEGGLGCNHCHDMHGEDPSMQVRATRRSEGACNSCHESASLSGAEGSGGHGGHGSVAGDVDCLDCHMPQTTYGLLNGMMSHRITNPDPAAWVGRADQPDACTQCHVDRSRTWAARSMADLGLHSSGPGREQSSEALASRVALDLHGGDPIQRNLAAHALTQPKATASIPLRMGWLAAALDDEYPSVRWFAWRGLRTLAQQTGREEVLTALRAFDYTSPPAERVAAAAAIRALVGPGAIDDQPELLQSLEEAREDKAIWIGE